MPPVEEIDEFDDDVSHLVRPDIEWTLPTSSSKPPPTPSLPPPIHWCWSFYSSSKKIKAPVCGARRPPSGALGHPSGAPWASGAPGAPRLAPVWGARRTSGPPGAPRLAPGAPMARI
ncbi:hypothetical protein TIFTF001_005924 [Ficus carica]|uniref:Uncharacterized protein n=1 Tax=Ficus carica TaxID=3494 RepID=A0AA87ZMS0_FICCA|nr:hypothetical protein TIFTF001_005924 [Ficus carica]